MRTLLVFLCFTTFLCTGVRAQVQIGSDIVATTPGEPVANNLVLSADGTRLVIGNSSGNPADYVRTYDLVDDEWVVVGSDLPGRPNGNSDHLRVRLSADGNRLVVGSPTRDDEPGQVEIYDWTGTDWAVETILGGAPDDDSFGARIDLSADGNTLIVGSPEYDTPAGSFAGGVRVFRFDSFWEEITGDFAVGSESDAVGFAVEISADGNRIAYSVQWGDIGGEDAGFVDVFDYNGTSWERVGQAITGSLTGDRLGYSLSMTPDGNHLAIGGIGAPWVGVYRVMELSGNEWQTVGEEYRGASSGLRLGEIVLISDDAETLVLPNFVDNQPLGVYIETFTGNAWTAGEPDFPNSDSPDGEFFALAGNTLALTYPLEEANEDRLPVVQVYDIAALTPTRQPVIPIAKLWPNPAEDRLNVDGVTYSEGLILDGFGRTVRAFSGGGPIATSGLPPGAYFVRLRTEAGWAAGRFLKR